MYNHENERTKRLRTKTFPPQYPNGWFKLCNADKLDNGKIVSISALGKEFVVFKGINGQVGVLDAYCKHLGANLGQGGCVIDNCIKCPFHGWEFDQSGKCLKIPYTNDPIPERLWKNMLPTFPLSKPIKRV